MTYIYIYLTEFLKSAFAQSLPTIDWNLASHTQPLVENAEDNMVENLFYVLGIIWPYLILFAALFTVGWFFVSLVRKRR